MIFFTLLAISYQCVNRALRLITFHRGQILEKFAVTDVSINTFDRLPYSIGSMRAQLSVASVSIYWLQTGNYFSDIIVDTSFEALLPFGETTIHPNNNR